MSTEVVGWIVCGVALLVCLTAGHVVQWFCARETARPGPATRPRVYGRCQVRGCHAPAEEVCVAWTLHDGEALDHRDYCLCRHHREQAQARSDDAIEDMVCV